MHEADERAGADPDAALHPFGWFRLTRANVVVSVLTAAVSLGALSVLDLPGPGSDADVDVVRRSAPAAGPVTDLTTGTAPPRRPGTSLVVGVNLAGEAVEVEGETWLSQAAAEAAGFSTTAQKRFRNDITWSPPVRPGTADMLNTVAYQAAASFRMSQRLPNGTYEVSLWLTENFVSGYRSSDIRIEGRPVARDAGRMPLNTWRRYGPFTVTVSDGSLTVDLVQRNGDPQVAGIAVHTHRPTVGDRQASG